MHSFSFKVQRLSKPTRLNLDITCILYLMEISAMTGHGNHHDLIAVELYREVE